MVRKRRKLCQCISYSLIVGWALPTLLFYFLLALSNLRLKPVPNAKIVSIPNPIILEGSGISPISPGVLDAAILKLSKAA